MKQVALTCCTVLLLSISYSQTLFTYGTNAVTKSEFENAFNKNPVTSTTRKEALKQYLDLYINFKLKVKAAYDEQLQADPTQIAELNNFKLQIADNFLNEAANVGALVDEAFARSQKDIHLSQVFIEVPPNTDTTEAYRKIQQAWADLNAGKRFSDVATAMSTDATTRENGGDLGYITVFTLPYIFENVAYATSVNNYSRPFRSALGYHIFKNLGERKPLGSRKVSQILFALPPNASAGEKTAVRRKADSVYQLLQQGSAFGPMARLMSNDIASASNNGELPEFGIGEYDPTFERAAYALAKEGDMTPPVETGFGFHIIRLDRIVPVETNRENIEARALLQNKVQKDARLELARKKMLDSQMKSIGYKPAMFNKTELWRYTDSMLARKPFASAVMNDKTVLFSFTRKKVSAAEWLDFVQMKRAITTNFSALRYTDLLQEFTAASSTEYYRTHLEDLSPVYKQQVQEFKEANLLFGVMDKHVWSKANNDTMGLKAYYALNKQLYKWEPSADALVITSMNDSIVKELEAKLTEAPDNWRNIIAPYGEKVNADSGRFELGQLPVVDRTNFQPRLVTAPVKNEPENSYTFNYIIRLHEGGQPRSFDDAKGMIISDYQQVLEDKWIAQLKKKYPVKVNQAVFATVR